MGYTDFSSWELNDSRWSPVVIIIILGTCGLKAENELKLYAICTKVSYAMKMNMENDEKGC